MTDLEPTALAALRVVLCRTSHAGNIGGAARAMRVMGLDDLALVRPREFPSEEADARATGAIDVLTSARVVDDLQEALADCVWVVGFTARDRGEGAPVVDVAEAAAEAVRWAARGKVAFLFGNERTGLENSELVRCNALALDAAAAPAPPVDDDDALASRQEFEALFQRVWREVGTNARYRGDDSRISLLRARFEQLMVRAQPTRAELRAAHGVVTWLLQAHDTLPTP